MTTVQQWLDDAASAHEDRHGAACDCDEQRATAALRAVLAYADEGQGGLPGATGRIRADIATALGVQP